MQECLLPLRKSAHILKQGREGCGKGQNIEMGWVSALTDHCRIFSWLHLVLWYHTDTKSFLITSLCFHKDTFDVMSF